MTSWDPFFNNPEEFNSYLQRGQFLYVAIKYALETHLRPLERAQKLTRILNG